MGPASLKERPDRPDMLIERIAKIRTSSTILESPLRPSTARSPRRLYSSEEDDKPIVARRCLNLPHGVRNVVSSWLALSRGTWK